MNYILASTQQQFEIVVEQEEYEPTRSKRIRDVSDCCQIPRGEVVTVAEPILRNHAEFWDCLAELSMRQVKFINVET